MATLEMAQFKPGPSVWEAARFNMAVSASQQTGFNSRQRANNIGFWCDWGDGDGSGMMIGGGGGSCHRADHGIGIGLGWSGICLYFTVHQFLLCFSFETGSKRVCSKDTIKLSVPPCCFFVDRPTSHVVHNPDVRIVAPSRRRFLIGSRQQQGLGTRQKRTVRSGTGVKWR